VKVRRFAPYARLLWGVRRRFFLNLAPSNVNRARAATFVVFMKSCPIDVSHWQGVVPKVSFLIFNIKIYLFWHKSAAHVKITKITANVKLYQFCKFLIFVQQLQPDSWIIKNSTTTSLPLPSAHRAIAASECDYNVHCVSKNKTLDFFYHN